MPHQLVVPLTDQAGDYDGSYGVIVADAIKIEQIANPPGTSQAEIHYIHSDHLNTPQRITNTAQQTVWAADYQPFGQATLTTASITNPLRFPGQYFDEETNLHYNYFRDYDPTTGRYIQSDPIGLAGGLNTYGYVGGNPLSYMDLFGLTPDTDPAKKYNPKRLPKIESYTPPESAGDKILKKVLDQAVKQITGIGGLVTKSPVGVAISSTLFSDPLNMNEDQDLEKIKEERNASGMCEANYNFY